MTQFPWVSLIVICVWNYHTQLSLPFSDKKPLLSNRNTSQFFKNNQTGKVSFECKLYTYNEVKLHINPFPQTYFDASAVDDIRKHCDKKNAQNEHFLSSFDTMFFALSIIYFLYFHLKKKVSEVDSCRFVVCGNRLSNSSFP